MKIITTVGTSLITNSGQKSNLAGATFDEANFCLESPYFKNHIKNKEETLFQFLEQGNLCAELATLKKIDPEGLAKIYLLCTETVESYLCGRVLQKYLRVRAQVEYIKGLQVNSANEFKHTGFYNLLNRIKEIKQSNTEKTVLNISGGYKALIPPITLLAQLEKTPLYYIYEDSEELIETGVLPINFDWAVIEDLVVFLHKSKKRSEASPDILEKMRELKLIENDSTELTIIGQMLKEYSKNTSPFTGTIFGYFIEHKLYETFMDEYGPEKVKHSVGVGQSSEDIDLLIKPDDESFISIEIKPASVLDDRSLMEEKIIKNIIERTQAVSGNDKEGHPKETWLLIYTYAQDRNQKMDISKYKNELLEYCDKIKSALGSDVKFAVKHFFIYANKLGDERHIYHKFMKTKINIEEIKEIFLF